MAYLRLGDLLVAEGCLTEAQLTEALELQKDSGKRLGTVLMENGFITEAQLIETLELQLGVEFIDLQKNVPSPEMARLLPKAVAKKYNIIPVKQTQDEVFLAMSDPLNFVAIEDVKRITKCRVTPMVATQAAIDRTITSLYGSEGAAKALEEMSRDAINPDMPTQQVSQGNIDSDDKNSAPTIRLVNSIIERAVTEHASDIHMEPRESSMVVRMRIDGVLRQVLTVPTALQSSVIARMKVMGGMDTTERRIPQDGRANVRVRSNDVDLRINTLPTIYGEKVVIRLLDKSGQILSRKGIGLDPENAVRYDRLLTNTNGVFLISGPTGSGKSSTMNTMIRELNKEDCNIVTLEDPVEYNIDGVNQVQINEKTGMTFANGLRSILRQDPDIIAVGEIRDGETAEIAMRSAITGHLVLSTIHTSGAIATLDRLYDIGVAPYLTASALKGVIGQRLLRKICPHCREAYDPTDEELDLLDMEREPGMLFYRGKGCPQCYHTGYAGRTAAFEILLVNRDIRRAIRTRQDYETILEAARKDGFITIPDRCKAMVLAGVTTAEEASKAIHSTDED